MKTCPQCMTSQPFSAFYKHAQMADGHLKKCKTCTNLNTRAYYAQNSQRIRAARKDQNALPHNQQRNDAYNRQWSRANRDRRAKSALDAYYRNPERMKAYNRSRRETHPDLVKIYSRTHRVHVTPPSQCERCADSTRKLTRHHPDYAQPLLIQWLCRPCHWEADQERRRSESKGDPTNE